MKKIKVALAHLATRLSTRKASLAKARRRHKKFVGLAQKESVAAKLAEREGHTDAAKRHHGRAAARQKKAIHYKGVIKADVAAIHGLNDKLEKRTAELATWMKTHGVQQEGENRFVGGTPHQRLEAAILKAAANYRAGTQPGYYSMTGGARDYDHAINHYASGRIWDCSTFADGTYLCCGLEAPSGPNTRTLGGWTGTEGEHGHEVSEADAEPGDLVLYGRAMPHHHVEVVWDPALKTTIGHGSPPIDPGIFDLFGDGDYEIRRYV